MSKEKLTRRELFIASLGAGNVLVYWWLSKLLWPFTTTPSNQNPTETPTPTNTATVTATRQPSPTLIKTTPTPESLDTYQLQKINLRGIGPFEKDRLQPAPDLRGQITLPDGKLVTFLITKPRGNLPGEDLGKAADWRNPFTVSYPNSKNPDANFFIQVGHTGTYKENGQSLPLGAEHIRLALEANSRPFTPKELAATIDNFKNSRVTLTQEKTIAEAKIKAIIRLSPVETAKLAILYDIPGSERDILRFTNQSFKVDQKKEFALLICGQRLLPGEVPTPNIKPYLQTRYFVFFTITS